MIPFMTQPTGAAVRERVRGSLEDLAPSERRVARCLLAAYPLAGLETITALADRAGVSGPTVTRFVAKLGFAGYRDFQQAVRAEVHAAATSPLGRHPGETRPADPGGILTSTFSNLRRLLDETVQAVSVAEFDAMVRLLADPSRPVWVTGGRLTQAVAGYLHTRLHQLRPRSRLLAGPPDRGEGLIEIERRDAVVVFDVRRYDPELAEFARAAAGNGAAVMLFTDRWLSPIAANADRVLVAATETRSPFDSLATTVGLVEALLAALVNRMGDSARGRMVRVEALRRDVGGA